ncbi:hypothetical protein CTA2_174, partial [Colletotrichum tanaceti]
MCYDDPGTVIIRTEGVNGIFRVRPRSGCWAAGLLGVIVTIQDLPRLQGLYRSENGTAVHTLLDSGLVPGDFHHARLGEIFFGLWPGPNFRDKTTGEIIDA